MESHSMHCTITATLPGFSSSIKIYPESKEYECDNDDFRRNFEATFYADGKRIENKGHVSIIFNSKLYLKLIRQQLTFSCTASVIDASGYKRFPQSFAVDREFVSEDIPFDISAEFGACVSEDIFCLSEGFGFERYLKRSTLLSDPSELLPDDSLTLMLEINFACRNEIDNYIPIDVHPEFTTENGNCYLRMDTVVGRDLCRMSSVFRRMMETDMAEKRTGKVLILFEEVRSFHLLFMSRYPNSVTLPEICDIYVVADKYDMPPITQLIHRLLNSVMREITTLEELKYIDEDMDILSELAERFHDDKSLEEILTVYSDIKNELESGTGELIASIANRLETEFRCEFIKVKTAKKNVKKTMCFIKFGAIPGIYWWQ